MGTWGPGLYANDLSKDLKATISSVMRLPLGSDELVRLLEDSFPGPSHQEDDEEYTTFRLVLADQFHKLGVSDAHLFKRAIEIIDSGADLMRPERQEMSAAALRKREKTLRDLRDRLLTPPPKKSRKTLSKPQPLLMAAGDVLVFPLFAHGNCINPYFSKWGHPQESWGAACIVRSGHVFEYLAYYYPLGLVSSFELANKPSKDMLRQATQWTLRRPGTCSKIQFSRMQLEIVDQVEISPQKLSKQFPKMRDGRYQAVHDICIVSWLGRFDAHDGTVEHLRDVVVD